MGTALWENTTEGMVRGSFLEWIHRQEEHDRLANYIHWDERYYGFHRDTMNPKVRKVLSGDYSVVSNFCAPVVDTPVSYLVGKPIGIDVTDMGAKTDSSYRAESVLNYVYKRNDLFDAAMIELVRIMIKKGDSFTKVYLEGEEGNEFIRVEVLRPDMVFPKFYDNNYREMEACAVKDFRIMEDGAEHWIATVYFPDVIQVYDLGEKGPMVTGERYPTRDAKGHQKSPYREKMPDDWALMSEDDNPFGMVPIFHFKNNVDDLPFGVSDLQVMDELQDTINQILTDLRYVMDKEAFQRLFLFGAHESGPFDIGPGLITVIANEGGSVQGIPPTSVANYLYAIDAVIDQVSAVTRTPRQAFQGYNDVPTSGFALQMRYLQLDSKCNEKKASMKRSFRNMNQMILALAEMLGWAGPGEFANLDIDVNFPSGLPKDEIATAQVHMYELQMGTKSRLTIMEERGIENIPEEIGRINFDLGMAPGAQEGE